MPPTPRLQPTHITMFTAYIDDSGSDPSQHVANATALIVPGRRMLALERQWEAFKKKEHFTDFHTSVFVARNPHTEFSGWDDNKQKRVFLRVRRIIKKFGVKVYSFTVHKKDYDDVVPADLRKYIGQYHYSWAIRQAIAHLVAWRVHYRVESPLEYVFDWMKKNDPRRLEIETVMSQGERVANDLGSVGEYTKSFDRVT